MLRQARKAASVTPRCRTGGRFQRSVWAVSACGCQQQDRGYIKTRPHVYQLKCLTSGLAQRKISIKTSITSSFSKIASGRSLRHPKPTIFR